MKCEIWRAEGGMFGTHRGDCHNDATHTLRVVPPGYRDIAAALQSGFGLRVISYVCEDCVDDLLERDALISAEGDNGMFLQVDEMSDDAH